jgi:predicted component of type VI protein secretion system
VGETTSPGDDPQAEDGWWVEWQAGNQRQRAKLEGELTIGRSAAMDVVVDDPYASRQHCVIRMADGRPFVDARKSLNQIRVSDQPVATAWLSSGASFTVGRTPLMVRLAGPSADTTWILRDTRPGLSLRRSTRELIGRGGEVIVRFSAAESAALAAVAGRHPDAADHAEIGHAVWGEYPFDQYQIHRLFQRIRQRLGPRADLIENVRGAGYRLRDPIELT